MSTSIPAAETRHQQLPWLDVVKGVGISMVVLGHINNVGFAHLFVYAFHMPLFFFVSGYLHRIDPQLTSFARKRARSLLIPYIAFMVTITFTKLPHFLMRRPTTQHVLHSFGALLWGGSALKGVYGVLWFLTVLFMTQQVMNYLMARYPLKTVQSVVSVGFLLSLFLSWKLPNFTLPLDAHVVPAVAPFFLCGHMLRNARITRWPIAVFAIFSVVVVAILILAGVSETLDIKDAVYGLPVLSHVLAVGCILATFLMSQLLPLHTRFSRALENLGHLSLPIMFVQGEILNGPSAHAVRRFGELSAFLITLMISWAIATVLSRYTLTRAFYLGSQSDLQKIQRPWPSSTFGRTHTSEAASASRSTFGEGSNEQSPA